MESLKVENLSFSYPGASEKVLNNISFTVKQGEFVVICGKSGCGKTTLLRLMKTSTAPHGDIKGSVWLDGKKLSECDAVEQTSKIGFVMQSPDDQIVTDKVWHELAFGLESLGCKTPEIRARVSEMASFFGIQNWFYKNVTELSGGQKQLLNLASVMVMQPSVLILDEPTSRLDPISAAEFLKTLEKINRELGTAVILAEHRLEDTFPMADRVIVMDEGTIIADDPPRNTAVILKDLNHDMYKALPAPMRIYGEVPNSLSCPMTVREGRVWLEEYSENNMLNPDAIPQQDSFRKDETVIQIKDAWFRYDRKLPDVVKNFNMSVYKGEMFCLLGGNGTGKTTALSLVSGLNTPYRGEVLIKGRGISKINNLYNGLLGVLPQEPQSVFAENTVYLDLEEMLSQKVLTKDEKKQKIQSVAMLCRIEKLLDRHPYDLSGGEQQRAALAKILLSEPEILLLDEPTKGMDALFKEEFADILYDLKNDGVTVVMVSHDIEFCAEYADRCALVFDGAITSTGTPREFFKGKNFYTTSANRMARTRLPEAVTAGDIIAACGGKTQKRKKKEHITKLPESRTDDMPEGKGNKEEKKRFRIMGTEVLRISAGERKLTKKALLTAALILVLIPLTIYMGISFFGDRKYYFISLLIILETMIPFFTVFESRRPKARELILISVLCAIAVAGRAAFFMVPQFKPVVAIVIIAGICFGAETGFLVGSVTGFVSNFFFGQGPWAPWQMFAFGIIGFIAGIIFSKGLLPVTKLSLCVFGFIVTFIIYGGIMNPASVIMWQNKIEWEMIAASYITGFGFDMIHACSTAFFLWFISRPMIEKLERIKIKYGLIE